MSFLYLRKIGVELLSITDVDELYTSPLPSWAECIRIDSKILEPFLTKNEEPETDLDNDNNNIYRVYISKSIRFSINIPELNATPMFFTGEWHDIYYFVDYKLARNAVGELIMNNADKWVYVLKRMNIGMAKHNAGGCVIYQTYQMQYDVPRYLYMLPDRDNLCSILYIKNSKEKHAIRICTDSIKHILFYVQDDAMREKEGDYKMIEGVGIRFPLLSDADPTPVLLVEGQWRRAEEFAIDSKPLLTRDFRDWESYLGLHASKLRLTKDGYERIDQLMDAPENHEILEENGFHRVEYKKATRYETFDGDAPDIGDYYKIIDFKDRSMHFLIKRDGEVKCKIVLKD